MSDILLKAHAVINTDDASDKRFYPRVGDDYHGGVKVSIGILYTITKVIVITEEWSVNDSSGDFTGVHTCVAIFGNVSNANK